MTRKFDSETVVIHCSLLDQAISILPSSWHWSLRLGTAKRRPLVLAVFDESGRIIWEQESVDQNADFELMLRYVDQYLREHG